jgi:hypothetical protein
MITEKLAEDIISLDISINDSIEKLTLIYWALKDDMQENSPKTELKNKLLFLKSYLASNITSYAQYNLSNDVVLLSNKTRKEKNEQTEVLRQIGFGNKEVLKYLNDPIYSKIHNYYTEREKVTSQTYNDFIKFFSVKMSKTMQKDWQTYAEKQLNSSGKDIDDKIIHENYINKQLTSVGNTLDKPKNQHAKKIISRINREAIIELFEQLANRLMLKLDSNAEIGQLVGTHFAFEEEEKNGSVSQYKSIKWWGSTTQLVYFVNQLLTRQIIATPDNIDREDIIITHFYYVRGNKHYARKDIQDAWGNILDNKNQKPINSEIIDELLDDLK